MSRRPSKSRGGGPGGRRRGGRFQRGGISGPGRPKNPGEIQDRVDEYLLTAHRAMQLGEDVPALEAAGEAVFLDNKRPDGYLLLGEIHLRGARVEDGLEAFTQARKKSGVLLSRSQEGLEEESKGMMGEALAGMARCHLLAGRMEQALGILRELMAHDPDSQHGSAQLVAELQLFMGSPDACLDAIEALGALGPDAHFVAMLAYLERGGKQDIVRAIEHGRQALLGNLYLPSALLGEDPPDLKIQHGLEEARPPFAHDIADRFADYLELRPERVEWFCRLSETNTVMGDVVNFVETARELNQQADPAIRQQLILRIQQLREAVRLEATASDVIREMEQPLEGH